MANTKTTKRDYLSEAYKILDGDRRIRVKVEHLAALAGQILSMGRASEEIDAKMRKFQSVMQSFYIEACKQRISKGLPVPPPPSGVKALV